MDIKFGSVCSGIEAASVAWHQMGWKADWLSEIEPFPAAVLDYHWPEIPNLGDMTSIPKKVLSREISSPDILVGGTPCQAFSVAGMREGLSDDRGKLTIKYVELLDAIDIIRRKDGKPEAIAVWENVPGVLSDRGNAFGCFLGALAGEECELEPAGKKWTDSGCVYGPQRAVAWRVLDAQYFGLAQRRRRVFLVASAREGFDPSAILFERDWMRRDSAPSREKKEEIAGTLASRTGAGGFPGTDEACSGYVQPVGYRMKAFGEYGDDGTASTMKARDYKDATDLVVSVTGDRSHCLTSNGFDASEDGTGRGTPIVVHGTQDPCSGDKAFALGRNSGQENVLLEKGVRRLMPIECERLQGFPDDHTKIPWRKKDIENCPDGPRYRALGNSMAVPVMRWIGQRIQMNLV